MKQIPFALITLAATIFSVRIVVAADALPMTPGMWETTTTTTNSFTGTQTQTVRECLTEKEFDPKKMARQAEGCRITEQTLSGNTLTFTMICNLQGGEGAMTGRYTSQGDSGSGTMKMKMSFGGQTMTSESTFEGRRVGPC